MLNLSFNNNINTPTKQEVRPTIFKKFIFSLKKILEIKIINIGRR